MNGSDYDGDLWSTARTKLVGHGSGRVRCPRSLVQKLTLTLDWVEEMHVHFAASSAHGGLTYTSATSGTVVLRPRHAKDDRELRLDAEANIGANPCDLTVSVRREFVYASGGQTGIPDLQLTLSVDLR